MKKSAFTLAEVLITLLIIGVVAALTIPSVISNYQQQEFKTGLKKAVSVLNEAIQVNIAQDGETPYNNSNMFTYLQRHMNVLKTGNLSHCINPADGSLVSIEDDDLMCYNVQGVGLQQNIAFYTADGMRFEFIQVSNDNTQHFYLHETGEDLASYKRADYSVEYMPGYFSTPSSRNGYCGSYGLSTNPNNTINTPCILIVDVNGDRKPNPPKPFDDSIITREVDAPWGGTYISSYPANQTFVYTYPSPTDKKLQDIFTIMITDEKAIPFGVVAQRAMYQK